MPTWIIIYIFASKGIDLGCLGRRAGPPAVWLSNEYSNSGVDSCNEGGNNATVQVNGTAPQ